MVLTNFQYIITHAWTDGKQRRFGFGHFRAFKCRFDELNGTSKQPTACDLWSTLS